MLRPHLPPPPHPSPPLSLSHRALPHDTCAARRHPFTARALPRNAPRHPARRECTPPRRRSRTPRPPPYATARAGVWEPRFQSLRVAMPCNSAVIACHAPRAPGPPPATTPHPASPPRPHGPYGQLASATRRAPAAGAPLQALPPAPGAAPPACPATPPHPTPSHRRDPTLSPRGTLTTRGWLVAAALPVMFLPRHRPHVPLRERLPPPTLTPPPCKRGEHARRRCTCRAPRPASPRPSPPSRRAAGANACQERGWGRRERRRGPRRIGAVATAERGGGTLDSGRNKISSLRCACLSHRPTAD